MPLVLKFEMEVGEECGGPFAMWCGIECGDSDELLPDLLDESWFAFEY